MTWRNILPIHPACDLFPMLSPKELRNLGEDIKANGLKVPIVVWAPKPDEPYQLLDGRNRLDAMEVAGLDMPAHDQFSLLRSLEERARRSVSICYGTKHHGFGIVTDPYKFVLSVNLHRRHLTAEQRRDLIAKVLKAKPGASNRQVARQVKADDKTVGKVRKVLEATADIPQLDKTVGADGKARTKTPTRRAPDEEELRRHQRQVATKHLQTVMMFLYPNGHEANAHAAQNRAKAWLEEVDPEFWTPGVIALTDANLAACIQTLEELRKALAAGGKA